MSTENSNDEIVYYEESESPKRTTRQHFFSFLADHVWQLFLLIFVLAYANYFVLQRAKNTGWSDSDIYSARLSTMAFDAADHLWTIDGGNVVEIRPDGSVSTYPITQCEDAHVITARAPDQIWVAGKACVQSFNPQARSVSWTDRSAFFMKGKEIVDLTTDPDGRVWVLATQDSSFSRFEDKVFLYRFADEKWNNFRAGDQHTYFRQPKGLVVTHDGRVCFKPSSWMQCRLPNGAWERNMIAWGSFSDMVEDSQGRFWGISNQGLTVCDEKCSSYTLENSGLNRRPNSLALDSSNRIWLSSYSGLRILDESKILPAKTLNYFVTANFAFNFILSIMVYISVIALVDGNRKDIPPKITVGYAIKKLMFSWILVGVAFVAAALRGDWYSAQSSRLFIALGIAMILVPVIRLVSLGTESKLSKTTFVLAILLGILIFIIVIGVPMTILFIFMNMQ